MPLHPSVGAADHVDERLPHDQAAGLRHHMAVRGSADGGVSSRSATSRQAAAYGPYAVRIVVPVGSSGHSFSPLVPRLTQPGSRRCRIWKRPEGTEVRRHQSQFTRVISPPTVALNRFAWSGHAGRGGRHHDGENEDAKAIGEARGQSIRTGLPLRLQHLLRSDPFPLAEISAFIVLWYW
jgi:hypothetical protein